MTYTATKHPDQFGDLIDEDGYTRFTITGPDDYSETYSIRYDHVDQWISQELAILNHPQRFEECEHGLSAGLCSGPQHY